MQTAPMQTLWSSQPAVMRPLDVHTVLVCEAPHTQTVQVQQPNTQTAATVHVPVHHLPQLCEVSPAFTLVSPETASMSLASPAAPTKEEQTKYFRQAEMERVLHAQRHPEWSCSDNIGRQKEEEIEEQGSHQAPTRLPPGLKLLHLNVMRAHSRPRSLVSRECRQHRCRLCGHTTSCDEAS
ncbi:transcription factor 7-like 2 [Epinephelus fuscoguttatus]|uniref:transcription factor 7-like 2 n=1 Tax=Epinephelus fuscoguttatus TaxID=293821 RepID=UPI0020D0D4B4|nr:transcription factor 7-like 2 [Epinephelus fuscoguttatus]XP_049430713.1 transcription factor 7-like 2 [Epinephelus fuscoguttatus]XP_049430714.1 transcription factor 7-like 2 [Epinephelus fuscoguttatus]XP_049430715.1 transcription factor 7-like 2 [Epinephelus fuscoguttatus]XP_049430716.1 transcription factor 7-like 2 [Epinephelus fuscoguttatus]